MNYKDNHQLQQRLLELHYDLLDEPQAAELRKAIQEDPDVAQQWAATLKLATKMSQAVAFPVDTPSVEQMRQWADEQESSTQVPSSDDQLASSRPVNAIPTNDHPASNVPLEKLSKAGRNGGAHQDHNDAAPSALSPRHQQSKPVVRADGGGVSPSTGAVGNRWWLQSFVFAVTAAAIGMLIIGSWYLERAPQRPAAGVRVQARLIPTHSSLTSNEFRVRTSRVDGTTTMGRMPVTPATLSFSVLAHNTVLYRGETETDSDGSGRIALPIRLTIPKDAKLRVEAKSNRGDAVSSILELPLPPTRCLTYLTTDRPVYRPGETVYFRSLTLQRHSLIANADVPVHYELQDPSGTVVPGATMEGVTDQGVGNGAFVIPTAAAGGTYTLVAKSLDDFFPEERVEFKVRSYRVPKFKKQLEFRHRSYGAGDSVAVDLRMQRASGEPVSGASVLATATVDDQVVHRQSARTSADGLCTIEFALPEIIDDGRGTVSVIVDDGGTRETITKTIPIHLGRVAVDFYPEGGYLVDGLDTRVYFMARNADGKPIHLQGEILNQNGDMVAQIETVRDGMGKFEFEPVHGQRYRLKVTRPLDVTNTPTLP